MQIKIFDCSQKDALEIQIWDVPSFVFQEIIKVDDCVAIKNKKYEVVGKRIRENELYVYPV